jgi:hypothetical protein
MTEEHTQQPSDLKQLRWCLQALAAAGSVQRVLFPDAAKKPDQLALEFDRCASVVLTGDVGDLSPPQCDALTALDSKLKTMAREGEEFDVDLWSETALAESAHWEDVRRHARLTLAAFGWSAEDSAEHEP